MEKIAIIKHQKDGWHLYSKNGLKHLGGPYFSREGAIRREKQVQYFKHKVATFIDKLAQMGFDMKRGRVIAKSYLNPITSRWSTTGVYSLKDINNQSRFYLGKGNSRTYENAINRALWNASDKAVKTPGDSLRTTQVDSLKKMWRSK